MIKVIFFTTLFLFLLNTAYSQSDSAKSNNTIQLSGSVDAYLRATFNSRKENTNNITSFTNSNQQLQLGMVSVKGDYTKGKFYTIIDLGFGKRAEEFSYNDSVYVIFDFSSNDICNILCN